MAVLTTSDGWTIESSAGSVVVEGNASTGDQGSGQEITFTISQSLQTLRSVYVQIVPVSGQTVDFWDNFWSTKIAGEPADQFALSNFVSLTDGVGSFRVNLNADTFAEGDETFVVLVFEGLFGSLLAQADFTIADDDEPGFAQHLIGTNGVDQLQGAAGADILKGFSGKDTLTGLSGNDRLDGGAGDDVMFGGAGNDTYIVDSKSDRVSETTSASSSTNAGGIDTVQSSVSYSIADTIHGRQFIEKLVLTGSGNASGTGNALANALTGNSGNNVLRGLAGKDALNGGAGNDKLYGDDGADTVAGGAGNDRLIGGTGRDSMTGGTGADFFVFDDRDFGGATMKSADRILDFNRAEGDRIDLKLVDSRTASSTVDNAFTFIGTKAFSKVAGELRSVQSSGNTYVLGDTDGNGTADFMIRIDGLHTFVSTDFVL